MNMPDLGLYDAIGKTRDIDFDFDLTLRLEGNRRKEA